MILYPGQHLIIFIMLKSLTNVVEQGVISLENGFYESLQDDLYPSVSPLQKQSRTNKKMTYKT
jgi:hypothetical protein